MRNASSTPPSALAIYALPEKAHLELVEMREHMRLMARLAEPGTAASDRDNVVPPHALAWWFKRIDRDISRILNATYWSAELQERTVR